MANEAFEHGLRSALLKAIAAQRVTLLSAGQAKHLVAAAREAKP